MLKYYILWYLITGLGLTLIVNWESVVVDYKKSPFVCIILVLIMSCLAPILILIGVCKDIKQILFGKGKENK